MNPALVNPSGFATFALHTDAQNPLALANSLRQLIAQRNNGLRVSNITIQLLLIVTLDVFLMIALGGCAGAALGFGARVMLNRFSTRSKQLTQICLRCQYAQF